jgi:hypothetical protein
LNAEVKNHSSSAEDFSTSIHPLSAPGGFLSGHWSVAVFTFIATNVVNVTIPQQFFGLQLFQVL